MDPALLGGLWTVALNEQTDLSTNQTSTSAVTHHFDLNISTRDLRTGNAFVGNTIFGSSAATVDSSTLLMSVMRTD